MNGTQFTNQNSPFTIHNYKKRGQLNGRYSQLICILILFLATALRWMQPNLIEYYFDEGHVVAMLQGVTAFDGYFPLLSGNSSVGVQRSALHIYLLTPFFAAAGGRIEGAVLGMSGLGILGVAMSYVLGKRIGGTGTGLLVALFMATNPWHILYDRKIWVHIHTVFSIGMLLLAWQVVAESQKSNRAAFLFPVIAALQVLSHILAFVQAFSWLGGLLIAPKRWWRRSTIYGILTALLISSPYLWALWRLSQQSGDSAYDIWSRLELSPGLGKLLEPIEWLHTIQFVTGTGVSSVVMMAENQHWWWQMGINVKPLLLGLIGIGAIYLLIRSWRGPNQKQAQVTLAWAVGPLLLLGVKFLTVYHHYWTVLIPLPSLYLALGWDWCTRGLARVIPTRFAWLISGALASALAVLWVGSYIVVLNLVTAGYGNEAFGVPLQRWQTTIEKTNDWAEQLGTQEVRVAVDAVDPIIDGEPVVVSTLIGNPPYARFVAPSSPAALLLSQDHPSLYLWTLDEPETEQKLQAFGEQIDESFLANGRPLARLYHLPPASELPLSFTPLTPEPTFDVSMALMGYQFPDDAKADEPFLVTLFWRVIDPSIEVRERDFTAFNHILDPEGNMAGQIDGFATLSRDWWPGDVLLQPYMMTLPAGTYRWRVGLYSRLDWGRSQLVTGGDSVDLEPLIVR